MTEDRKLIFNADDFGRHAATNEAVRLGVRQGCLRSASLMAGEPAFAEAVEIAKGLPKLGIGVHFTLVDGNPVLPPEEIPTLVNVEGRFQPSHNAFLKHFLTGRIRMEEVQAELAAQLAKIEQAGIRPTHIDSHQHMHALPGVAETAVRLAKEAGIAAVRVPDCNYGSLADGVGAFVGRMGLHILASRLRREARKQGLACTEHFAGLVAGGNFDEAEILRVIREMPEGTTEVMTHPGTDDELLATLYSGGWQHGFEAELAGLLSEKVAAALEEGQVQSVNFGQYI